MTGLVPVISIEVAKPCHEYRGRRIKSGDDKSHRSRDAIRTRVIVTRREFLRSPHRSSPENSGGGCRYPHDPCFKPRCTKEESKEAERRQTRIQPPHLSGCGARRAPRARLSASHHGSCQRDVGPQGSASGQASWDVVSPGVTRCLLSQSSGSTPRTGRNAGEHDAQSRPGTAVTSRRPREPTLAPLARVIDQRPCTRARLPTISQTRNAMSRSYFPLQLMPIWRDILRCANCDSVATSVRFEHKDSLSWQRFTLRHARPCAGHDEDEEGKMTKRERLNRRALQHIIERRGDRDRDW
jgi:hypothetical protein